MLTAADVLALHVQVWDMPTLATEHPAAIAWLAERYEVIFGMLSEVALFDKRTATAVAYDTTDVRVAVQRALEAEVAS